MDRRYLSRILLYLLLSVFAVSLIIELFIHIYTSSDTTIMAEHAEPIVYNLTTESECLLIRNESVISDDNLSIYLSDFSDREKVARNTSVADSYIYDKENYDVISRISEDRKTLGIVNKAQSISDVISLNNADNYLSDLHLQMCSFNKKDDLSQMRDIEDEVLVYVCAHDVLSGDFKNISKFILNKENEISLLRKSLHGFIKKYNSEKSSYVYMSSDNMSSVDYYNAVSTYSFSFNDFDDYLNKVYEIDEDYSVPKFLYSTDWFCLFKTDKITSKDFLVGNSYNTFIDDELFTLKVYSVINDKNSDDCIIVLQGNDFKNGSDTKRFANISIIKGSINCYKIPCGSLRYIDSSTGLFVMHGSVMKYVEVEVVYSDESYFYVTPVNANGAAYLTSDKVIVSGKDLKVGRIIN